MRRVNRRRDATGRLHQLDDLQGVTSGVVFDLSRCFWSQPGDMVDTGTQTDVAPGRSGPPFLPVGDRVGLESGGLPRQPHVFGEV